MRQNVDFVEKGKKLKVKNVGNFNGNDISEDPF
jgi:hypothetical protein